MRKRCFNKVAKVMKRVVALLLFMCMLSQHCFVSYGETDNEVIITPETTAETNTNSNDDSSASNQEADPYILYEIKEKRDKKTKHFAMSDGTIKAYIYPQHVHYLKNGKYEEIDNSLIEVTEKEKTYYRNKENGFLVKIPKFVSDDYIEFSDENGYVKFKLQGTSNKTLEKVSKDIHTNNKDITVVKNANQKAVFKKVKGNIDIEYDLNGNKLKETIVLNKKTKNSFVFDVQTSAAKAVKNNDNSISFFDASGIEIYMIASPYMTDNAGEYSNAIETELITSTSGYTLIYQPDDEWLSAKEREYPVRIDPTLTQAINKNSVTDTYITNIQPADDIRGAWDVLNIGKRKQSVNGNQITMRGLIRFDLPSEIGKNDCIVDAKLDLIHYTEPAAVSVNGLQVDVHELTSGFTEGNTYWGNQPSYDPIITDYALVNTSNMYSGSTLSYDSYNLTKLVNKWHNGDANYGIMLKIHNEETTVSSNAQVYYFARQSLNYGSVSKFVEITYRNTIGLEDYWSYTTQDFGRYGQGYVNLYNGNLIYVHEDVTNNSLINGFTLTHVYNSCIATQQAQTSDGTAGHYGVGWNLNFIQKFEPVTINGNSDVKFKYTDGDGTEHYFVSTTDGKIVDEDGLGLSYQDINEGEYENQITDKNGTVLKFDGSNYLRQIMDSNGNAINLAYTANSNTEKILSSITTSSGDLYTLSYDSNYKLLSITDNAGRVTSFYYHLGLLTEIHYPDETLLKFGYGTSNCLLQNIVSPNDTKIRYEYNMSNHKVTGIRFHGADESISTNTSIEYLYNQTKVSNIQEKSVTYQFDMLGRATCIYDDEQNVYSQTYTPTTTNGSGIFSNNKLALSSGGVTYIDNMLKNPVFANGFNDWVTYKQFPNPEAIIDTTTGLITSKSVKITTTQSSIDTIIQFINVSEIGLYTYSGYIKAENVQSNTYGAGLEVYIETPNGPRYIHTNFVRGTSDNNINNGFELISVSFYLNQGEYVSRISAGLFDSTGTLYIDSLQLEKEPTRNNFNLLTNSGMEINSGAGTMPSGYQTYHTDDVRAVVTEEKRTGNYSFKINGSASQQRNISQFVETAGKKGDVYSFGGWIKANSAPFNDSKAAFLAFCFEYQDGTIDWVTYAYNPYISDWQFGSKVAIAKSDYVKIGICFCYYYNCNTAYCDNLFICRDVAQSYAYDNEGNIISSEDYANQNENFEYKNNVLTKLLDATGSSYEYLYDNNQNLKFARSSEGVSYKVDYDSQGNPISTSVGKHSYSTSIQSGKTYYIRLKSDGKYLTVANAGTVDSTNVIEAPFSGGDHQKWKLESTDDGYYILAAQHTENMVLDVANQANLEDTNVQIYSKNNCPAQKFKIEPQSNYAYKLIPECSSDGKILTVNHAVTSDNVTILSAQGEHNPDQEWYFEDAEQAPVTTIENHAIYQFRARLSGKYFNLTNNSDVSETALQQYEANFSAAQKFVLMKYMDTEYFTIRPLETEGYIAVSVENNDSGYPYLMLGDTSITEQNLFKFIYNSTYQGFLIIPKCNETLAVDIMNCDVNNGISLILNPIATASNQFFIAEKMSDTITTSATYQDNGNFLNATTDARGNTTTYIYDTDRGLQTGVTDAKGNTTEYIYNALNDRLESVESGNSIVSYQYESNGAIKKITAPSGTSYNFTYDTFGRTSQILIGTRLLSETLYKDAYSALVSRLNYGNGVYKTYEYDSQERLTSESINGVKTRGYLYDKRSNIAQIEDFITNVVTKFQYDMIGRTIGIKSSDGQAMDFVYDTYNRLSLSKWSKAGMSLSTGYIYGDNSVSGQKTGLIYSVTLNGTSKLNYQYDVLTRLQTRTINTATPYITEYGYLEGATANTTTTLVKTLKNGNDTLEYAYDEVGNITSVKKNGTIIEQYTYDALNQLVSAVYGGNTYTYAYDNGGNITEVKKNGVTIKSYTYGNTEWKDLLTVFNGENITYDAIGNPLIYHNGMSFTWQNGRQLASISQNGIAIATYTYNADGLRTSKTVNGVTTEYYWLNGTLYGQKTGNEYLYFLYDESGTVYGFIIKDNISQSYYYYEYNLQGDIIGIIDSTGNRVVEYTYGAWGDILSINGSLAGTIGQKNPLRYRGYYYDAETGFYYVSSRYYDHEIGRFLNADSAIAGIGGNVNGYNLYSYCFNNPVNMSDPTGNWPKWINNIGSAVKAAINTVVNKVKSVASSVKTTILNAVKGNSNSLPTKGEPGSSQTLKNPDGTPKQKRWYGPDGNAERDRDYNHQGDVPFPHDHEWNNGKRGEDHLTPSPAYEFSIEPVLGAALVGVCAIGIVIVAADDVTYVGVADDFLFGPLGTGVSTGLIMMFP